MTAQTQTIEIFGFTIPILSGGKRQWPLLFKQFISTEIDEGNFTVTQVAKACRVSKSQVYQWRMQAKGKPVTATDWRAKAMFAPVVVETENDDTQGRTILVRGRTVEVILPMDYPVSDLIQIIQATDGFI